MDTFAQRVQEWQAFYATVATACATLTGLLFVSLSLNIDIVRRAENRQLMQLAQRTFADFLYGLMISLVFLIPQRVPIGTSVALFALGLARVVNAVRGFRQLDAERRRLQMGEFLRVEGLSLAASLGLIGVGVLIVYGLLDSLFVLVLVMAALLVSGSRNAWFLLVHIRASAQPDAR